MAFNPFHAFRKHQKVVFAGLTIVCMLTFVLAGVSGGIGDVFAEMTRLLSGARSKTEVARLYGKSLGAFTSQGQPGQLLQLREQRRQANMFMETAMVQIAAEVFNRLDKDLKELSKTIREANPALANQFGNVLQLRRYAEIDPKTYAQQYVLMLRFCRSQLDDLQKVLQDNKRQEEANLMGAASAILDRDYWRYEHSDEPASLYFGGSLSLESLLDFLIWSHEADRLGIQFTAEDIRKQVQNETLGLLTPEMDQGIRNALSQRFRWSVSLLTALGEEFRVRAAQAALTGYDPNGMTRVPAQITPYDLWEYYVRERTEVSVKMLPIPVSRFESQVKEQPSKEDLEALYRKYRNREYSPGSETPGFKLPRRIKVEWAEVAPTSAYYRTLSRNLLLSAEGMAFSNPLNVLAVNAPFVTEYQNLRYAYVWNDLHTPPLSQADFVLSFYTYRYLHRPTAIAAILGRGAAGDAGAFAALFGLPGDAQAREARDMAPAVAKEANRRFLPLSTAMVGAAAGPLGNLASFDVWLAADRTDERLPFDVVEGDLLNQVENKVAEAVATANINALREALDNARKDAEKNKTSIDAAARKVVDQQIAAHKWPHGASTKLESTYDIAEDPGLAPLKEAYQSQNLLDRFARRFGDLFFADPRPEAQHLYSLDQLRKGDDSYVYWKTADQAPEVVPFDKAEPKVKAAWYLEKARPLAQAEAERIAKEAKAAKGDAERNLLDAAKGQPLITLDGIARISRGPSARADIPGGYSPYVVPEDKIRYPRPEFVDTILSLTNVGDVAVVSDQPATAYYVVAVTHRIEPTQKEFQEAQLFPQLERLRRREYRADVLQQLRAQAHLFIDEENRNQMAERGRGSLGED
jgi:hypothetical protein